MNVDYDEITILSEIKILEKKLKDIVEYENYLKIMKNIERFSQEEDKIHTEITNMKSKEPSYRKTFLAIMGKLCIEGSGNYSLQDVEKINLKIKTIQTDYMKCPSCEKNLILESGELKMKKCVFMKKDDIEKYNRNLNNINFYYRKLDELNSKKMNLLSLRAEMEIPEKVSSPSNRDYNEINKKIKRLREISFHNNTEELIILKEKLIKDCYLTCRIRIMNDNYLDIFDKYNKPKNFNSYYSTYINIINKIEILTSNINDLGELERNYIESNIEKLQKSLEELERYKVYKQFLQNEEKLKEEKEKRNLFLKKREGCTLLKKIIEEESSNTFENLIINFNDSLNEIVSEIFEDISINLGMFKRLKAKGELKPQFNMKVMLKGNEYDNLHFLSGGEKDRISIALTLTLSNLLNNPIIMFDESMSSLDEEMRERCLDLIRKHASNKILINICHSTIEGYYDKIIRI